MTTTIKTRWIFPYPEVQPKRKRGAGFAGLSQEERDKVSSKGGKAVHAAGTAYSFTPETAREAAKKSPRNKRK